MPASPNRAARSPAGARYGALAATLAAVLLHNALLATGPSAPVAAAANVVLAALVAGWALGSGIPASDLGLGRDALARGLLVGGAASALVVAGVALLATSGALDEVGGDTDPSHVRFRLLVGIPIGTALAEELLFRGALLAAWDRVLRPAWSTLVTSAAFGLWHVVGESNRLGAGHEPWAVLPAVLATGAASALVLCPLRRRTGSLVAPVLVHGATNASVLLAVSG